MTTVCEYDIIEQQANENLPVSVDETLVAKNRRLAKKLNALGIVHGLYGGLDGLSLSYSMVKYGFDLLYTDSSLSSSDIMHDWLMTPEGLAASAAQALFIVSFSFFGNIFKDDDKNALKRYIALCWPYFRDALKGLKNGYKGVRSALQAAGMLSGQDLRYLMVPIGLVFGLLSAANRMWYRQMKDKRKEMQANNTNLLLEIQANCRLHLMDIKPDDFTKFKNSYLWIGEDLYYVTPDGICESVELKNKIRFLKELKKANQDDKKLLYLSQELTQRLITNNSGHQPTPLHEARSITELYERIPEFYDRIGKQTEEERLIALLSAAYGGVVDGLYLYMGAFALASVAPPVFAVLIVFSTIYSLACIATRTYEEWDYQQRLISTQAKVELALLGKELEVLFASLQRISEEESKKQDAFFGNKAPLDSVLEPRDIMVCLELTMEKFEKTQAALRASVTLSYQMAALSGLKHGLATYGAILSVMFAVATIYSMLLIPFPPALLISCVLVGMAFLIGFVLHSLISNHLHQEAQKPMEEEPCTKLSQLLTSLKNKSKEVCDLEPTEVKEAILDGMAVDPSPQFFFQEAAEVARSVASGVSKGQKSIDYTLNHLQESDDQGHYHDTSLMLWLTLGSSSIYALGLGLRAYAKGFSQDPPVELVDKNISRKGSLFEKDDAGTAEEWDAMPNESDPMTTVQAPPMTQEVKRVRPRAQSLRAGRTSTISASERYGTFFQRSVSAAQMEKTSFDAAPLSIPT